MMPERDVCPCPGFSVPVPGAVVTAVSLCGYPWAGDLVAVGTQTSVTLGTLHIQESSEAEGPDFQHLRDIHHGTWACAISWSPETNLVSLPRVVRFCTAGGDKKLRIFTSDLKSEDSCKLIDGHTSYINDVAFEPEKGEIVASVSDDHTCRLWDTDGAQKAVFPLGAPGMAVQWHTEDPMKIMVAEKKGVIRFYSVVNQQPVMSLDCGRAPLLSADWCHGNGLHVVALAGTDRLLFDTSRSSRPIESRHVHSEGGRQVKWSRSHSHLVATLGSPGAQFRVFSTKTGQAVVSSDYPIANGISWHHSLPLVAVGGDKKIYFWHIDKL